MGKRTADIDRRSHIAWVKNRTETDPRKWSVSSRGHQYITRRGCCSGMAAVLSKRTNPSLHYVEAIFLANKDLHDRLAELGLRQVLYRG